MSGASRPCWLALAAGLALWLSGVAFADDEAQVWVLRARALAHEGRCDAARELLERPGVPSPAAGWAEVGKCGVAARSYDAAVQDLTRALALDPGLGDAHLYLGICAYHQNDIDGAREALSRARSAGVTSARLDLYTGMIELRDGQNDAASASFARARDRDASAVEPAASYYEGIALERSRDFSQARAAFSRATDGTSGPFGDAARRGIGRVGIRTPGRRWAEVTVGGEYNDNVVLQGSGVDLPSEISDDSDASLFWAAQAGMAFYEGPVWQAGGLLYYFGSEYDDLDDFDVEAPSAGLFFDYDVSETTAARFRYDYGYAWVGSDSFLTSNAITGIVHRDWEGEGRTEFFGRGYAYNYRYPIPTDSTAPPPVQDRQKKDRDRDGNGLQAGFDHAIPLDGMEGEVRFGYAFERYFARGDDYSFQGHHIHAGALLLLPFDMTLDLDADYGYEPYRNASSFADPDTGLLESANRRDSIWRFEAVLEREFLDGVFGGIRYRAMDHSSNTDVFDYTQQVVGAYVTVRLER